jgi:hypothetical protein
MSLIFKILKLDLCPLIRSEHLYAFWQFCQTQMQALVNNIGKTMPYYIKYQQINGLSFFTWVMAVCIFVVKTK